MLRNKDNKELVNNLKELAKEYGHSSASVDKFTDEEFEKGSMSYVFFLSLLKKYARK